MLNLIIITNQSCQNPAIAGFFSKINTENSQKNSVFAKIHANEECQHEKRAALMMNTQHSKPLDTPGFTLSEVMITTAIVGILSSLALPNFLSQVNRTRQKEASSTVAQIQTTIAAYADEFGVLPESWAELNDTSAVMTDDGPATKDSFGKITLAGGYYDVAISNTDNLFTITATSDDNPNLNIIACVNLTNGASGINQGTKAAEASAPNCG